MTMTDTVLADLDWQPALPCTWGALHFGCDHEAVWTITCRACGGIVYRCDIHLAVERYRARTAPLIGCPVCRETFRTHGDLDTVAIVRRL